MPYVLASVKKHDLTVTHLLLTHAHIDHIVDAGKLKKAFPVPLFIHKLDAPGLLHPRGKEMDVAFQSAEGMEADHLLEDGDFISVGNFSFQVLFTPGHSLGVFVSMKKKSKLFFQEILCLKDVWDVWIFQDQILLLCGNH